VLASCAAAVFLLLYAYLVARALAAPMRKLKNAALAVGRGDLRQSIDVRSRDEIGDLAGAFNAMVRDLRRSHDALLAAKTYSESVLWSMSDLLIVTSPEGAIRTVNRAACGLTGYEERELLGQPLATILMEQDNGTATGKTKTPSRIIRDGLLLAECVCLAKDGRSIPLLFSRAVMYGEDGRASGVVYVAQDVTERNRAEQQVREQNVFLTNVVESLTHPFYVINARDYTIRMANSAAAKYGAIGARTTCHALTHGSPQPCHLHGCPCPVERVKTTGEPFTVEHIHTDSAGGSHICEVHAYPLFDEAGAVTQVILYSLDITERRHAEEALKEAARHKDEFLALLGHELRNPLAPIRTAVALLKNLDASGARLERVRTMLDRQVLHLARLVDDLLDVSRIARGKVRLKREPLELTGLVQAVVEDHRNLLEGNGLTVELVPAPDPIFVSGDAARLAQVVSNLLHNAGKFTDAGGCVTVAVRCPDEKHVHISVRDTGIGMDRQVLTSLFEPFRQADQTLDRARGGLGLGLALVKGVAEMHGGQVRATSAGPGLGSEFVVTLPVAVGTTLIRPPPDEVPVTLGHMRRVLIIEDNADAAESLQLYLSLAGHQVSVARSGSEGLEKAHTCRPEFVVCDIGLPGSLDGYGVASAMRADPELHSTYLIALTGYGMEEDRRRAQAAGFDQHLVKPVDPERLARLLSTRGVAA
jgi:PAS domain S-box-containing protein